MQSINGHISGRIQNDLINIPISARAIFLQNSTHKVALDQTQK
jgi:hypothetical protein